MRFRTTRMIQPFLPFVQWRGPDHCVYLTFDDGPHPSTTPAVLKELNKRNIKGSFFVVGRNARRYPELVADIHSEGHTIGNHTYDHIRLLFRNEEVVRAQLKQTMQVVAELVGERTTLFRPPFGHFGPAVFRVAKETGHRIILWDVDTFDYGKGSPLMVARSSFERTLPGSIVLLHDSEATQHTAAETLDRYLDLVLSRSLKMAPLPS